MLTLKDEKIIYVTRDLERALGLSLDAKGYYIISNYSDFAKRLVGARKNVLLVKEKQPLDTRELLAHPKAVAFVKSLASAGFAYKKRCLTAGGVKILVFKNTQQIEKICLENGWPLLNPSARLAGLVEEKISQTRWLGDLAGFLPPHKIVFGKELKWEGKDFVVQFNRAHTGGGTMLIKNENDLSELKTKFPEREVRVAKYISGPSFTNNNVVWGKKVLRGNISYQITGLEQFTKRPFATVGNDWALPNKILSAKQRREYADIADAIGKKLAAEGWKGEFGIDVIMDNKTGRLYLIEINARQPASTSCESWLQTVVPILTKSEKESAQSQITTFEAHILSLLGKKYQGQKLIKIKSGAQITQKATGEEKIALKSFCKKIKKMENSDLRVFVHDNNEIEKDFLRLQTAGTIMSADNELAPDFKDKIEGILI